MSDHHFECTQTAHAFRLQTSCFLGSRLQMQIHKHLQSSYVKIAAVYGRNACELQVLLHESLGDLAVP
jgi:hypothetical protein